VGPAERFRQLPGAVRLAALASVVLIAGTLFPWIRFGTPDLASSSANYDSGLSFNSGQLDVMIGVLAIALLARSPRGRSDDPWEIGALGLLACAVTVVSMIRYGPDSRQYTLAWGIYVTAGGAGALLLSGLGMLGLHREILPPPD
jgi:hypothetical protein